MKKKTKGIFLCVFIIIIGLLLSLFIAEKIIKTIVIIAGVFIGFAIYNALKKKDNKK